MTTDEAIAIAQQMEGRFAAFQHITEVLIKVSAAENVMAEMVQQREVMAGTLGGLKQEIVRVTDTLKKKKDKEAVDVEVMAETAATTQKRLSQETADATRAHKEAVAVLERGYLAKESKLKISIDALRKVETDTRARVDGLETIYADTKAKVAGL